MAVDPALLAALNEALQKDPQSVPLRLHLAGLLMQSGGEQAALEHYGVILVSDRANVPALDGAAQAADAVGDAARANGYRQLLRALEGAPTPPTPASPTAEQKRETPREGVPVAQTPGDPTPWWEVEWPNLRLKDVGGMEHVKRRLDIAFLGPMRNPDLRKAYGKSLRGGLLLYGPPGCGKTFIARAAAGELGASFFSVGISDVLDMYTGQSERNLARIFAEARRRAPCVLFFDELDALGQKRSHLAHSSSMRNTVNQMLSEMDSATADNDGVFVLAATNHPWDIDIALRRPGRFDRMVLVLPPDAPARAAILEYHLRQRPIANIDLGALVAATDQFSGADLAHLCETAAEHAMADSLTSGTVRMIEQRDFT